MSKKENNARRLLRLLESRRQMTLPEAVETLGVSPATARRLFAELAGDNRLIRILGGVRALETDAGRYSFNAEVGRNMAAKSRIGARAALEVADGDRIFVDSGTTALEMVNGLAERLDKGELADVTLVSNSLAFAEAVAGLCRVTLIGGDVRSDRRDLAGAEALASLANFRFHKAFLGVDAIDDELNLLASDRDTALLARQALAASAAGCILADASKLGGSAFARYGELGRAMTLITDRAAPEEFLARCRAAGAGVIIAP